MCFILVQLIVQPYFGYSVKLFFQHIFLRNLRFFLFVHTETYEWYLHFICRYHGDQRMFQLSIALHPVHPQVCHKCAHHIRKFSDTALVAMLKKGRELDLYLDSVKRVFHLCNKKAVMLNSFKTGKNFQNNRALFSFNSE